MAGDSFQAALAGFLDWAHTTDRTLSGDPDDVGADIDIAFSLIPDYLLIDSPAQLTAESLTDLLLKVYPRRVTVVDRKDAATVVPAMRDLTAYLADSGTVSAATAQAMTTALDEIEPKFADAVMDPANWSMATSILHAMHSDGVDIDDQDAVDDWIARRNQVLTARRGAGDDDDLDLDIDEDEDEDEDLDWDEDFDDDRLSLLYDELAEDEYFDWDDVDLKEDFGLPDILPPIRHPDADTLAKLASTAPLMTELRNLARDVRGEDDVQSAAVDPLLLALAEECELVEVDDDDTLLPGDDVEWLDDLSAPGDAVEAWEYALGQLLDITAAAAEDADDPELGEDLDLGGQGLALVMELMTGPRQGTQVTQLSASLKDSAVAELEPQEGERQWQEWTGAHGDLAELLLGQLEKLGAVSIAGGVARLEPLALYVLAERLRADDVMIPELPPVSEMTAEDVALLSGLADRDDFQAEVAAWAAERTPEAGARDLLAFAAGAPAVGRLAAIEAAVTLGEGTEPAWREVLGRPEVGYYAKRTLARMTGGAAPAAAVPAELVPGTEEIAWALTDGLFVLAGMIKPEAKVPLPLADYTDAGWTGTAEELLAAMGRIAHPDAEETLTMLGRHCEDKKIAKAARKAAYQAASSRSARQARAGH